MTINPNDKVQNSSLLLSFRLDRNPSDALFFWKERFPEAGMREVFLEFGF